MKIMCTLSAYSGYQAGMVGVVAFAYLAAPLAGKVVCKAACPEPKEIVIPIAGVYGTTGDSAVITIPLA